ncbi:hypothetical protein N0V82_002744 [Gnomoniopsis sp. IMI 355080]|nr:hypothetical protein N0V82_002744 [Gnomoniopsis sp. IMI 355080]
MAFFAGRGGNNPRFGRDTDGQSPNRQAGGGFPFFFPQHFSHPVRFFGQHQPVFNMPFAGMGPFAPGYPPGYPPGAARPITWPSGGTAPANLPIRDPLLPSASLRNSTGGVGCEVGYNYFFPAEHTKIHVLQTGDTPPWLIPSTFAFPFHAVHVPVNTFLGDLLKGFGACNPDASKNRIFEVHQGGGGKWYKGMCLKGDDSDMMDKTIKSIGWDATRTGLAGGKPVVYLYVTKG